MLKHSINLNILFLVLLCACNRVPIDIDEDPIVLSDEERWMESICSPVHMGRKAGTQGCDSVAAYLQHELGRMRYEVVEQPFRLKDSLNVKNLFVVIEGVSDSLIVLGAHYDGAKTSSKCQAADDNGSGVVTLLSICKHYSNTANKPPKTLVAGFWTAEEVTLGAAFNGSKHFVKTFEDIKLVTCYCNLDCFARKGMGTYFYYSPGFKRVGSIMTDLISMTDLFGMEFSVKMNEKSNSDYMSFYNAKIPYFGWNDYNTSGFVHSADDSIEKISFEQIGVVKDLTIKLIDCL